MHGCNFRQAAVLFAVSLISLSSQAASIPNTIPNFHNVERGIYRGGSPGDSGVAYLQSIGVKTILNLDNRTAENSAELAAASRAGIRVISVPMSGFWAPSDQQVNAALKVAENASLRPLFVHCEHGWDRTGLVMGIYRVESEHWQPGHAYEEMKALGFHPSLIFLNHYFENRTGFED